MIRFKQLFFLVTLFVLSTISCKDGKGDDPQLTEVQIQTQLLTGESVASAVAAEWSVDQVQVDDIDYTEVFTDFALVFTNTGFTTQNGGVVFGSDGTWSFTDDTAKKVELQDGLELTLVELTETSLVFEFTWNETLYGRTKAVGGVNTFTMSR